MRLVWGTGCTCNWVMKVGCTEKVRAEHRSSRRCKNAPRARLREEHPKQGDDPQQGCVVEGQTEAAAAGAMQQPVTDAAGPGPGGLGGVGPQEGFVSFL